MQAFLSRYYTVVFTTLILTIAGLAFYVGILEGKRSGSAGVVFSCRDDILSKLKIPLEERSQTSTSASPSSVSRNATEGAFAGSKNGTKYYTPGCAGLERIKPENLIWFQSEEDATLQGYTPASC